MNCARVIIVLLLWVVTSLSAPLANSADYIVEKSDGGPLQQVSQFIEIAKGSSLRLENIVLNHPDCPIRIDNFRFRLERFTTGFHLSANPRITANLDTAAIELRTRVFDVFGQHMGQALGTNLVDTEITDIESGNWTALEGTWHVTNEMAKERLTLVTYVHQVRLADGRIWVSNAQELDLAIAALELRQIAKSPE